MVMKYNVGISTYLKEDYNEILQISEDRDNMDGTWDEWKVNKDRAVSELRSLGTVVIDIIVRPDDIMKFCLEKGVPINGDSRAHYVQEKVRDLS
jgi:hypothetical protein